MYLLLWFNTYSGLTFDHANIATAIVIYSFNNFARICRLYTYVDLVSYTKMQTLRNIILFCVTYFSFTGTV